MAKKWKMSIGPHIKNCWLYISNFLSTVHIHMSLLVDKSFEMLLLSIPFVFTIFLLFNFFAILDRNSLNLRDCNIFYDYTCAKFQIRLENWNFSRGTLNFQKYPSPPVKIHDTKDWIESSSCELLVNCTLYSVYLKKVWRLYFQSLLCIFHCGARYHIFPSSFKLVNFSYSALSCAKFQIKILKTVLNV